MSGDHIDDDLCNCFDDAQFGIDMVEFEKKETIKYGNYRHMAIWKARMGNEF